MHRLDREWLWVAPADGAFAFGLVPGDDGAQALRALQAQTPAGDDRPVYAGSVLVGALPAGCLAGRRSAPSRSCVRRCLSIPRRSRWPVVWRCARRIVDVSGQLSARASAAIGDALISGWALLLQVMALLLALFRSPASCVTNRRSGRRGWRCWVRSWRH